MFVATGTLANGSTLSGYIDIDIVTGAVDSLILPLTGTFSFTANYINEAQALRCPLTGDYDIVGTVGNKPTGDFVGIILGVSTLVGFNGGNICTNGSPCNSGVADAGLSSTPPFNEFVSGSLT